MNFSLRFQSYSYLTAENSIKFIQSPITLVCLFLLLVLFFLISYFESCVLLTGFRAAVIGRRASCGQLLVSGFLRGIQSFHLKRLPAALPFITFGVVSNLYFIYHIFYRLNPFCTFLPIFLRWPAARIAVALVMIVLAVYAFLHLFSFCFLFFCDKNRKDCKRGSRQIFFHHPFLIVGSLLSACIVTAGIWHLLRVVSYAVMAFIVSLFVPKDLQLALTLTLNQYIILITLGVSVTIGALIQNGIVTVYFYRFADPADTSDTSRYLILRKPLRYLVPSVIALLAGIVVYLYFGIYNGTIRAERAMPFIHIAAHRGVSSEAPENTLPAIELAINYLADSVEIDVQCTEDGEVVVFHDISLKRITGVSRALEDVTYEELQELDAGDLWGSEFAGTPIPTLAQVMELAKGRINLIIELKRNKCGDDLAQKVVDLIEEYDMQYQCVIQSPDYQYLRQVKELNPELTTGYILSTAIGNYYNNEYIDFFCVRSAFVTQTTVRRAHAAGKEIFAWTVNSREELERMKRIQVDTIITDYPILAREILYRESSDWLLADSSSP